MKIALTYGSGICERVLLIVFPNQILVEYGLLIPEEATKKRPEFINGCKPTNLLSSLQYCNNLKAKLYMDIIKYIFLLLESRRCDAMPCHALGLV